MSRVISCTVIEEEAYVPSLQCQMELVKVIVALHLLYIQASATLSSWTTKMSFLQVSSGATSWSPALCFPFCRAISLCSIWCCLPPSDRQVILTSSVLANSAHSMSCQALLSPFLWSASVKDTPIQSSLATVHNSLLTVKFLKVVRPFNAAAKEAQALRSHCNAILIALNIHFPRKASLVLKGFEDLAEAGARMYIPTWGRCPLRPLRLVSEVQQRPWPRKSHLGIPDSRLASGVRAWCLCST